MSRRPQPDKSVRLVPQRHLGDCGVAALAGYLSLNYGDVAAVARRIVPDYQRHGMTSSELCRISRELGYPLRDVLSKISILSAIGIADIDLKRRSNGHFAVLNRGLILDGNEAMPVDYYLAHEHAQIAALYALRD